jgi:exosortase
MAVLATGENAPIASTGHSLARSISVRRILLLLVLIEALVLYLPALYWLLDRWTMSVWHNAHGMFTAMLVSFLIWRQLKQTSQLPTSSSAWGFAFVVPALMLHALDAAMHTQLLGAVSLVLILPGLSLLFLGIERSKSIAFPLAFATLMLPIPLALTEPLQMFLREITTAGTAPVIRQLGVPVLVEGTTLHLAETSLLVSDACSGFSTLYAALVVASLTAYNAGSAARGILVMIAAPVIAVLANILRVILLTLLVNWRGDDVLGTWLHPASGVLTFALALPLIFLLGGKMANEERS